MYRIASGRGPLKAGAKTYTEGTFVPAAIVSPHLLECGTIEEVVVEQKAPKKPKSRKRRSKS